MEQINRSSSSSDASIVRNVEAVVTYVDEKLMRLKSRSLNEMDYVQISAPVAFSIMPRRQSSNTNLSEVIHVGDWLILDVVYDHGYFVPHRIRAITLMRQSTDGGNILIANGLLINITEYAGPLVRSAYSPDFIIPIDKLLTPHKQLKVGSAITFEAVLTNDGQLKPLCARTVGGETKMTDFPIYRGIGTVCYGGDGRSIMVRGQSANGPVMMPIFPGAFYGCGIPIFCLIGGKIRFTACPQYPSIPQSPLQMIYFEVAPGEVATPMNDRLPAASYDGSSNFTVVYGEKSRKRVGIHDVQACKYFNSDIMEQLKQAFVFVVDRSEVDKFERILKDYPSFCMNMCKLLGLDEVVMAMREKIERQHILDKARRQQTADQRQIVPKPPDFTPGEVFGDTPDEPPITVVVADDEVTVQDKRTAHDIWFEEFVATLPPIVPPTPVRNDTPPPPASTRFANDESYDDNTEFEEDADDQRKEQIRERGDAEQQQPRMRRITTPLAAARECILPMGRSNLDFFEAPGAGASGDENSSANRLVNIAERPAEPMWSRDGGRVKRVVKGSAG